MTKTEKRTRKMKAAGEEADSLAGALGFFGREKTSGLSTGIRWSTE